MMLIRSRLLWLLGFVFAAVFLTVASFTLVNAQDPEGLPPDLDGSLGYDTLTTCWRLGLPPGSDNYARSRIGTGYDWAWPGCGDPGSDSSPCGDDIPSGYPLSEYEKGGMFVIFPASVTSLLETSDAVAIAYVEEPSDSDERFFAYRAPFVDDLDGSEVPLRNCFVTSDNIAAVVEGQEFDSEESEDLCPDGIPVFSSRRDYVNYLYGVIDQDGITGYGGGERRATQHDMSSIFAYGYQPPTDYEDPEAVGRLIHDIVPWWSDPQSWHRVPASETAGFRVGWLHPDAPEGGLTVDYAYLLRQQHYMNAELLSRMRSYSTDGHRVTRGVRTSPDALVFTGLAGIRCNAGSTCSMSIDMNQAQVRQVNMVYLEVEYNPAPNRVGEPFDGRGLSPAVVDAGIPTPGAGTPLFGGGAAPLTGEISHSPEYFYYDVRDVDHPTYVGDSGVNMGQLSGAHGVPFGDRRAYPTPDGSIFSNDFAADPEYIGFIKDYPDTKYDSLVVQMRIPSIYRSDAPLAHPLADRDTVSLFGTEHGLPVSRDWVPDQRPMAEGTRYTDNRGKSVSVVAGYEQFALPAAPRAEVMPFAQWGSSSAWPDASNDCNPPAGFPESQNYPFAFEMPLAVSAYDEVLDIPNLSSSSDDGIESVFCTDLPPDLPGYFPPEYVEDAFWLRWPVVYSDVAWYLFELDGFNKAVADDADAINRVIGHSGMADSDEYPVQPAYQLDPALMGHAVGGGDPAAYATPPYVPHRWTPGRDAWGNVDYSMFTILSNHRNTAAVVNNDRLAQRIGGTGSNPDMTRVARISPDLADSPTWVEEMERLQTPVWQGGERVAGGPLMGYEGDAEDWRAVYYPDPETGFDNYPYAAFGGDPVPSVEGLAYSEQGGQQAYHGLSFVPMRTPYFDGSWGSSTPSSIFYDPGGVLVKRGVAGADNPGVNTIFGWEVRDSQQPLVTGAVSAIPDRVRLGMAEPGSHFAYLQSIQWPDLGLNPNRTHLMLTLYFEARQGDPMYLLRRVQAGGVSDYVTESVIPTLQMRPVMCRTLVQPLGVNQGGFTWSNVGKAISVTWQYATPPGWVYTAGKAMYESDVVQDAISEVKEAGFGWLKKLLTQFVGNAAYGYSEQAASYTQRGTCFTVGTADDVINSGNDTADNIGEDVKKLPGKEDMITTCGMHQEEEKQAAISCVSSAEGMAGDCPSIPAYTLRVRSVMHALPADGVDYSDTSEYDGRVGGAMLYTGKYAVQAWDGKEAKYAALPDLVRHSYTRSDGVGGTLTRYRWDFARPTVREDGLLGSICPSLDHADPASEDMGDFAAALESVGLCRYDVAYQRCDESSNGIDHYGHDFVGGCVAGRLTSNDRPLWRSPHHFMGPMKAVLEWDDTGLHSDYKVYSSHFTEIEITPPRDVGRLPITTGHFGGYYANLLPERLDQSPETSIAGWDYDSSSYDLGYTSSEPVPTPDWERTYDAKGENYVYYEEAAPVPVRYMLPANWIMHEDDKVRRRGANYLPLGHLSGVFGESFVTGASPVYWGDCRDPVFDDAIPHEALKHSCYSYGLAAMKDVDFSDDSFENQWWPDASKIPDQWLGHVETGTGDLVSDLGRLYPLIGDMTYTVRVRAGHFRDKDILYGDWSNVVHVGPSTLCPLVPYPDHRGMTKGEMLEHPNVALRLDLGCDSSAGENFVASLQEGSASDPAPSLSGVVEGAGVVTPWTDTGDLPGQNQWFWTMLGSDLCTNWFDSTPAKFSWGSPIVVRGWGVIWVLAISVLALMILWQGIRMTWDIWLHGGWANQRDPGFAEMVPRFLLAIILAAASFWICQLVIVLITHISCFVHETLDVSIWQVLNVFFISFGLLLVVTIGGAIATILTKGLGLVIVLVLVPIATAILSFFVVVTAKILFQMILRLALIMVLIILSPLAFMFLALPDTEGYFRKWMKIFVAMLVTQTLQLIVLYVSFRLFYFSVDIIDGNFDVIGIVISIAVLYLTTKMPELMDRELGMAYSSGGQVVENMVSGISKAGSATQNLSGEGKEQAAGALKGAAGNVAGFAAGIPGVGQAVGALGAVGGALRGIGRSG